MSFISTLPSQRKRRRKVSRLPSNKSNVAPVTTKTTSASDNEANEAYSPVKEDDPDLLIPSINTANNANIEGDPTSYTTPTKGPNDVNASPLTSIPIPVVTYKTAIRSEIRKEQRANHEVANDLRLHRPVSLSPTSTKVNESMKDETTKTLGGRHHAVDTNLTTANAGTRDPSKLSQTEWKVQRTEGTESTNAPNLQSFGHQVADLVTQRVQLEIESYKRQQNSQIDTQQRQIISLQRQVQHLSEQLDSKSKRYEDEKRSLTVQLERSQNNVRKYKERCMQYKDLVSNFQALHSPDTQEQSMTHLEAPDDCQIEREEDGVATSTKHAVDEASKIQESSTLANKPSFNTHVSGQDNSLTTRSDASREEIDQYGAYDATHCRQESSADFLTTMMGIDTTLASEQTQEPMPDSVSSRPEELARLKHTSLFDERRDIRGSMHSWSKQTSLDKSLTRYSSSRSQSTLTVTNKDKEDQSEMMTLKSNSSSNNDNDSPPYPATAKNAPHSVLINRTGRTGNLTAKGDPTLSDVETPNLDPNTDKVLEEKEEPEPYRFSVTSVSPWSKKKIKKKKKQVKVDDIFKVSRTKSIDRDPADEPGSVDACESNVESSYSGKRNDTNVESQPIVCAPCQDVSQKIASSNRNESLDKRREQERMEDNNEFKYQEVVRNKKARQSFRGFTCEHCNKFIDAVCNAPGGDVFDRGDMVDCSRHRCRHTPPETPEGFWDMSFADEKKPNLSMSDEE